VNAKTDDGQQYTGLILLTGIDTPGIASKLFSALEPFSIHILDIEQLVIRSRLFLTVLIGLDPAHAQAIEDDLNSLASKLDLDIAMSFGAETSKSIEEKSGLLKVTISAEKLKPVMISDLAARIVSIGVNIERIQRLSSAPKDVYEFQVSGTSKEALVEALSSLSSNLDLGIADR
jgi:phosphoserine phosphatase